MNDELRRLGEEYWEYRLEWSPTTALLLGDHRYDTGHEDLSRTAEDTHIGRLRAFAHRAELVDEATLTPDDRVSRDVLIFDTTTQAAAAETRPAELFVSHTTGPQAMLPVDLGEFPLTETAHAEAMLDKYVAIARSFDQRVERLREGMARDRTPIGSTARKSADQVDEQLALPLSDDPYVTRLVLPSSWSETDAAEFRGRLAAIVAEHVRPAYQRYRDAIVDEVLPVARSDEQPGVAYLADGEETYARMIQRHTTMSMDPREIHEIGRQQIAGLATEYRQLGAEALGSSDLATIFMRLRDDAALHFNDGPSIVAASEQAMSNAKAAMGDWFGRLPLADCIVKETMTGPTAFYQTPSLDGARPGTFYVNTKTPSRWSTFEIEAMAYHEGIPGHHLQLAIAQELADSPMFRKHARITAYAEGWGLYSERLADEMGLYSTPLDRIGMLQADSMRAGRLVVDTGLHALGWSRQEAIDYLLENSPMSLRTVENEVDRYIVWPGQALAYMLGRLEIVRIRAEAEATLGDSFDIKAFHDTVLGSGLVPLMTLDRMVRDWVAAV